MKIKVKKTMSHGDFAKYVVDKHGMSSFKTQRKSVIDDTFITTIELDPALAEDTILERQFALDTVTFEVEEEITADTVIPRILAVHNDDGYIDGDVSFNMSVRTSEEDLKDDGVEPITFHYVHDDGTLTLLWKDGKMV